MIICGIEVMKIYHKLKDIKKDIHQVQRMMILPTTIKIIPIKTKEVH